MNVSKGEQRTLHTLAQGGFIKHYQNENKKIETVECYNRDGFILVDCTLDVFNRLRKKKLISSKDGKPYRINRNGLKTVRAQLDNR